MKKFLLTAVLLCTALVSFAQINFETGYIIDNSGNRSSVFIRNVDWRNNPSVIEYKISETSEAKTASVKDIQEFGIGDYSKFVRQTVMIDQSSDNLSSLSKSRNPEFLEETVFLRMLIEGKADLYQYTDESSNRFFYAIDDAPIEQLVYKKYQTSDGQRRGTNNLFRQQLLGSISCEGMNKQDVESLEYSEEELRSHFKEYHECANLDYVEYITPSAAAGGEFDVKVQVGIYSHDVKLERIGTLLSIGNAMELESEFSPGFGLQLEYFLPFNKQKWSVFSGASYYQVKGEKEYQYLSYDPTKATTFKLEYSALALPLGIRHYFFLSDKSAIFVNGAYEFTKYLSGSITDSENIFENEIEPGSVAHSFQLGVGYTWNKKIGAEVRYGLSKDYLAEHAGENSSNLSKWEGSSSYLSFLLSYTLF